MAKRPPLTHFLCIPLLSQASRSRFEASSLQFKERLRALPEPIDPDVLGRAIRPVGTIHLTLGVMSLNDQERIENAVKFLDELDLDSLFDSGPGSTTTSRPDNGNDGEHAAQSVKAETVNMKAAAATNAQLPTDTASEQFTVTINSLKTMKKADKTSILYAEPIDASNRLLPFCEQLKAKFTEAGFVHEENRPLKLHATVLNTLYASSKGRKGPRNRKPMLIDATEIISQLEDFKWAEGVVLEKVAICEMGAKKIQDEEGNVVDERYTEIASKPLPA